jgi:hypothetical protein
MSSTTNNRDYEDSDTGKALRLSESVTFDSVVALNRLRDAVRAGDVDAMRAAYTGRSGFLLGLSAERGAPERIVLEEVLRSDTVPLAPVLNVFFGGELGGRFIVDREHNTCIFAMLVHIDATMGHDRWLINDNARWTRRVDAVVRHLVEELDMPIRMRQLYRAHTTDGHAAQLIDLAWNWEAWACYHVFAQYITLMPRRTPTRRLERLLARAHFNDTGYTLFWMAQFAARIESDAELAEVITQNEHRFDPARRALFDAEIEHRRQQRQQMRALMMLQTSTPENAGARGVFDTDELSHLIMRHAFADSLY